MKKTSSIDSKTIAALIGVSAAAGVVTNIVGIIIKKLQDMHVKHQSAEYYKKMLEAHPKLKKEDPEVVAKYWASLYHFSPFMAQDPLSAGAYIRQSLDRGLEDLGGPGHDTVNVLADINRKMVGPGNAQGHDTVQGVLHNEIGNQLVTGVTS